MLYAGIGIFALIVVLSIIFRVAAAFRLTIPLLYALLAPTLFSKWFYANYELANIIGYALLALVALSWVVSFVRKVREWRDSRNEDKMAEEMFLRRLEKAKENGEDTISTDGLYRE